ncbi:MAG: protein-L-isoaspartate(D-aspartate) O-methyltransferase [Deltaproteobacteria bacterium]|nr:protein-L-isoaspartate(D-aspartate) O-methyltransferase [Deltaproteobacteria bacterium]
MDFKIARKKMLADLIERGIRDPRVLEVMGRIPRHEFVDPGMAGQAYQDHPLNIGLKQTISQPFMVALMTEALGLKGHERVLEIGTGSGYQTAILAELCRHVYSIERISSLSNRARRNLYRLGYVNFTLRIGDGTVGWPEEAPFDEIMVTAGSPQIPTPYLEELVDGGILLIPEGDPEAQQLIRVQRHGKEFQKEPVVDCRFVKLYGQHGWKDGEA